MSVTDEDRERAAALVPCHPVCARDGDAYDEFHCDCGAWEMQQPIAAALAEEREKANPRGGLPNNPEPGKVAFRIEAWPHDSGANGEEYVAGHMPAGEAASWLREIADRCERYWGDPECPWAGQPGHAPADPARDEEQQRRAEEAKAAAYRALRAAGVTE